MRTLLLGILAILVIGVGGFVYRNAAEHPNLPIACPLDARVCPDGTSVGRTGQSCTFPPCPPPNVTLASAGISYAVPSGFVDAALPDGASIAAYEATSTAAAGGIVVREFAIASSSTALATIQATAIGGASALPVPSTGYSSVTLGGRTYTTVNIERFEGVVDTAYYLARQGDVLRFDAIDRGVAGWTDPGLELSTLPAEAAVRQLLTGLQSTP